MEALQFYAERIVDPLMVMLPSNIIMRGLLGAAIGGLIAYLTKPLVSFNPDGSKRPWAPQPFLYEAGGPPTLFPWFAWPLMFALLLTVFI